MINTIHWKRYLRVFFRKPWVRIFLAIVCFGFFIRYGFFNHNEPTEIGIARNLFTGETYLQGSGWHFSALWVLVPIIDTRPVRVSVPSAGHGYSAKLVQFQVDGWQEFVATEGFRYWWWAKRLSFNFGYNEEYRGMKDILRGYAYGTKSYPFFKIITEYQGFK